jgi:hypothetical protein
MPIRRKSSINKIYYESIGQQTLFGHDNLHFKTVNHPKKHQFKNLCPQFNIKLIIKKKIMFLKVLKLT